MFAIGMCGVFSHWVSSHSGGHPRGMARTWVVWGALGISLTNSSQEGIPHLALGSCYITNILISISYILLYNQYLNQHFSSFLENLLRITQSLAGCLPPAVFIIASCKVCFMELSQRKKKCAILIVTRELRGPGDFGGSTVPGSH